MRFASLCVVVGLAGCTEPNPRACQEGACIDPAFPFCDVDGKYGGAPNECVAISCTPGEVVECQEGGALTCDAAGTNYEVQQCIRGCDMSVDGCIIEPSNALGRFLDDPNIVDELRLENTYIDTATGTTAPGLQWTSVLEPAAPGGVAVRVFAARRVVINNVVVRTDAPTSPALAILAIDELAVEGPITFEFGPSGNRNASGAVAEGPCVGAMSQGGMLPPPTNGRDAWIGGGGGANATPGAAGGIVDIAGQAAYGMLAGGVVISNDLLVPLVGGCNGGGVTNHSRGGGALQLSSLRSIKISGRINVDAKPGTYQEYSLAGGGAGGSVLLEAPTVEVANSIQARGAGGSTKDSYGGTSSSPSSGGTCNSTGSYDCGNAGTGGTFAMPMPTPGADVLVSASSTNTVYVGGGGGGIGRVRINTNSGTFTLTNSQPQDIDAAMTMGTTRRFAN